MGDKLLIRAFDVGLGDCIYCRIPQAHESGRDFHILIDCGSLSASKLLSQAMERLKPCLPQIDGKRRIDLLVVTHEHKDHMTGFGLKIWDDFSFGAIWMSAAMDLDHPESQRAAKLHSLATKAMERALALNLALSPPLRELANAMALNKDAMATLRATLPKASNITPVYVHAASTEAELSLPIREASLSILGPEKDIDHYYLGKPGDPSLRSTMALVDSGTMDAAALVPAPDDVPLPANLDPADFRKLRSRMVSSALAFADLDGKVCNNTSVVLLIEWRSKRLLFVGDAEWDQGYRQDRPNCSWNVMWNRQGKHLNAPLAFLKIGHHGSVNATPWRMPDTDAGEPAAILDAILPVAAKDGAKAVVSTRRGNYETIPRTDLLAELGKRVANARNYANDFKTAGLKTSDVPMFEHYESAVFGQPQPRRTDLEGMLGSPGYVDVEIEA
ncbi:metallohydrolase [Labrys sp. KNU-23]|nr:metallohydrolase [Labrys sp. KNU-23]